MRYAEKKVYWIANDVVGAGHQGQHLIRRDFLRQDSRMMRKAIVVALAILVTGCSSGGGGKDDNVSVVRRFCLPGSDDQWWEHVDLSDGRTGVPTGATC